MNKRLRGYRLLQASPLIVAALIGAAWFSLPLQARHVGVGPLYSALLSPQGVPGPGLHQVRVDVMKSLVSEKRGLEPYEDVANPGSTRVAEELARGTAAALAGLEPAACDENGVPRTLTAQEREAIFAKADAFEDAHGAAVAVFVISSDPEPPVALASVGDPAILTDEERAAIEGSGTVEALRRLARGQKSGPIGIDIDMIDSAEGQVRDGRFIAWSTLLLDGRLWETYTIVPDGMAGDALSNGMWESLDDPVLQQSADAIAHANDGAVLIVGPLDAERHVVRPAPGLDAEASSALWGVLDGWRSNEARWQPVELYGAESTLAGGADLMEIAFGGPQKGPHVAVAALYNTYPVEPMLQEALGDSPLVWLRVWLGTYLWAVIGVLVVLLAASLVASPLAFRSERIYREDAAAEQERTRIQREAEIRVVRKLDELSARVDSVTETASDATIRGVSGVAEDIDSTVAELRSILGDVVGRGDSDE